MINQTFREWLREQELNEMAPTFTPQETGLKEYIWISSKMASHGSLSVEFYTGVDNIRFDSRIKLTEEIQIEINEFIKHGLSKSVLNYI